MIQIRKLFLEKGYISKYFLLIVISIFLYTIASVICPNVDRNLIEAVVLLCTLGSICFFLGRDCNTVTRDYIGQILIITIVIALFWNAALISKITLKTNHMFLIIVGTCIVNYLWLLCVFLFIRKGKILFDFKKILLYLFIFFLFFVGNYILVKGSSSLDGYIYYDEIRRISSWDFCGIYKLQLCGHISTAYSCFALIGEFITPQNIAGVRIIQIIIGYITVYAFGEIMEVITSDKIVQIICIIFFAFSPILYGTALDINLDYPLFCFFIWFVSCYMHKKYILMTFCGLCVCYTKEVGCVLFGAFFVGIFIDKLLIQKKDMRSICTEVIKIPNLIFIVIGVVWIITFVFRDVNYWMTNITVSEAAEGMRLNTFAFDREYIIYKLKEMLFINFGWLFLFVSILAEILFKVGKRLKVFKANIKSSFFPIGISCSAYIIFNLFYFTWPHYRYMNLLFFFFVVFMINAVHRLLGNTNEEKVILAFVGCLVIVSSFFTIDPFSARCFMTYKTNGGNLAILGILEKQEDNNYIVTNDNLNVATLDNSTLYNSQMIYFKHCINKVFTEIDYDINKLILIPRPDSRSVYGTLATIFGAYPKTGVMYWDVLKEKIEIDLAKTVNDYDRYQRVSIKCISDISEISDEEMGEYEEIYFWDTGIYENIDSEKILNQKVNQFPIIGQAKTVGWCWDIYKLK